MKHSKPRNLGLTSGALAALLCVASWSLPAHAGKSVTDADLIRILTELKDEQKGEFGKNVDRWKEVEELLKEYVKYSKAEETRHGQWQQNQSMLGKEQKDKFVKDFRQMSSGMREVKGKDLASQALAAGLSEGQTQKPGIGGGGGPIGGGGTGGAGGGAGSIFGIDLSSIQNIRALIEGLGNPEQLLKALGAGSKSPKELETALKSTYTIWDTNALKDLEAKVQQTVAGGPQAKVLGDNLINTLQLTKHSMDEAGRDLRQVQATAKGSGTRLTAIEALVAQAGELGGTDAEGKPKFDNAKLAELRTYLTSVSAMQNEELIKLQTKDMGDRAASQLKRAGAEAKQLDDAMARGRK
jgi:hypothetical protein